MIRELSVIVFVIIHFSSTSDGVEPAELNTKVGEFVVLDCEIEFPQNIIIPHSLQWRKDGELVFSWTNGNVKYHENFINRINLLNEADAWQRGRGSVNITNIRETDEGWYECKVIFPNQSPSSTRNGTWFHLLVEGGNLIAVPPVNATTMEGSSVQLKCISKMFLSTVVWYQDGVPVLNIDNLRERVQVLPEGSLYIMNTEMKDSGYFSCEISNDEGEKQVAGAYLNVQFKAKVVYAPKRVYLPLGQPGNLECYYKANPDITKIRWEKDGFLFDAYNVPGVFARRNGSLYFSKIDDSHAGEYTCTPYNDLGTSGPSPRMQVVVQKAPIFTITPHVLYLRKIGESVVMHCEAVDGQGGLSQPAISWSKKNGDIIKNRSTISGGNLTIGDIQISDQGTYECTARNEAATITSEAELLVQETVRAHAPYNVTADVDKNSVTIKWLAGYRKPDLKYSVWYRYDSSQDWRMIELDSNMYEVKIKDLAPGQTYHVMVLSQNNEGDGMFSKTVRVTTRDDEPEIETEPEPEEVDREFRSPVGRPKRSIIPSYIKIGPPTDLYVRIVEEGYRVVWNPPKHGREMLRYYTAVWYRDLTDDRIGTVETNSNFIIVRNLEEQKMYKFQVFAMSTNDYEAPSQKYIYHVPSFPVKKPLIIGAAGGALLVAIILSVVWYFLEPSNRTFIS